MTVVRGTFKAAVFDVDLKVGGLRIPLAKRGDTWSGSREIDVQGDEVRVELCFVAPSFTDWSLTVKKNSAKILEESGTSQHPSVCYSHVVAV